MKIDVLRQELAAQHVILSVSEAGKLRYDAPAPLPVELVNAMKEHKAALLEALQTSRSKRPALDLAQQPGHCGCCARWEAIPERAHMGNCSAGRKAHGWLDGAPLTPVETQAALHCAVDHGRGWRPARAGQTHRNEASKSVPP